MKISVPFYVKFNSTHQFSKPSLTTLKSHPEVEYKTTLFTISCLHHKNLKISSSSHISFPQKSAKSK